MQSSKSPSILCGLLCLHNISMNHGCVDDINEEILEDLRRRDVELQRDWTLRRDLVREWQCAPGGAGGWRWSWGEEEGAQQEQVVRLEAHAPWLQQSSPDLRRCAREAAATSPPG